MSAPAGAPSLVGETLALVRPRLARLAMLLAPFSAAIVLLLRFLPEDPEGPGSALAALMIWGMLLAGAWALAVVGLLVGGARRGVEPRFGVIGWLALGILPRVAATHLLTIAVLAPALILIVPGVRFAMRFAFAPLAVALEGTVAMTALRESRARVERARHGFWLLVLVHAHLIALVYLVENVSQTSTWLAVDWLIGTMIGVFTTTASVVLYERAGDAS